MSLFYHKIIRSANNRSVLEIGLHVPRATLQVGRPSINHYRTAGAGHRVVAVLGYDFRAAFQTQGGVPDDDLPGAAQGVVIWIDVHCSGPLNLAVEVPTLKRVEQRVRQKEVNRRLVDGTDLAQTLGTLVEGVDRLSPGENSGARNVVVG